MGKPSIFYVITSLNRGGAETHLWRVLPDLKDKGYDISIITIREKGELAEKFEGKGIRVFGPLLKYPKPNVGDHIWGPSIKLPIMSRFGSRLWYLVRMLQLCLCLMIRRPDVIHFFLPEGYLIGGIASIFAMLPNRVMSRRSLNVYQSKYPAVVRKLELILHKKMKLILGNSQEVVSQLISDEGCDPTKVRLIYNGMRKPKLRGDNIRAQFNIDLDDVVFTQVANLIPYKGYEDLIRACATLPKDKKWKLLIVGADRDWYREVLETLVLDMDINDRVIFTGPSEAVADIYAASDVGVLASHEEGFSNAILEGMAAKLPMVVTNVGGNAEAVLDKQTGLVVPPHAPKELGQALTAMLEKTDLRERYGSAGLTRLEEKFSHQVCVDTYDRLYQELIKS
ncbi:glycosyltransferase [Curvivirga sp.]|uniref:glycosyltransferase n=1 Tax=Curvivirga sp. TaxID=2856848 RepID=UPI003B592A98